MTGQEVGVMPKESVYGDAGPFRAVVGWASDRDVQMGVECDRPLAAQLYDDEALLTSIGERVFDVLEANRPVSERGVVPGLTAVEFGGRVVSALLSVEASAGVWVTLDRAGCNRLIRVLRRARDAAYGADQ